jgi:hypothetical protein
MGLVKEYPNMPSSSEGRLSTGLLRRNLAVADELRSLAGSFEVEGARNW